MGIGWRLDPSTFVLRWRDELAALLILRIRVHDPETYKKYTAQTPAIIESFGGRFLVRGGAVDAVEGPPEDRRVVVIEFESMDRLLEFYNSETYQKVLPLRLAASEGEAIRVEAAY